MKFFIHSIKENMVDNLELADYHIFLKHLKYIV